MEPAKRNLASEETPRARLMQALGFSGKDPDLNHDAERPILNMYGSPPIIYDDPPSVRVMKALKFGGKDLTTNCGDDLRVRHRDFIFVCFNPVTTHSDIQE